MKNRLLGAFLLIAILLPLLLLGGIYFSLAVAFLAVMGMYELICLRNTHKNLPLLVEVIAYLLVFYLTYNQYDTTTFVLNLDYRILSFLIFTFFLPVLMIADNERYNLNDAFFLFGSTIFIGLSCNLIILIRNYSLNYLLFLFVITIMTDTFAYISGSLVGRHKLCPEISPGKTVEGLIFGTLMGVISSCLFYLTVIDPSISLVSLLIVTVTLSLVGQLGDLVFSSIKRHYHKKDFSNLIPGHGGVLDRFDSIIFVALAAIIFLPML